jgi:CRISPR/Cas system-associated endonuclease Cas1
LADAKYKAERTLNNNLADLAYEHERREREIARGIVEERIRAAQEIEKAYRDMIQSLAEEDWRTAEDIEKAKKG